MIKLTNIVKKYDNRIVLKNINHEFPLKGISVIYGPSGSGKTTLLNCIAGLINFTGSIQVNHRSIENLNDYDLSALRLSTYGFIFQDFKLFETETVISNLLFPLETLFSFKKEQKLRKCRDLLALVGLQGKEKQVVNKLSGGEKQRVAIARALINDPSIILADEPTGALDEQNGIEIMNIIKKISKKALVIIVSHDQTLTKKYADEIIEMDNGEIVSVTKQSEISDEDKHLPVVQNGIPNTKGKIPDSFLLNHTFHTMKQKKLRTGLCYTMTSLGLIGVGLAFALSSTIASNIKQAYREIVDDNSIIVSLKDQNSSVQGRYAANFYETNDIKATYPEYINDVGVTYYCNFEKFFKDKNTLAFVRGYAYCEIPGFSARHINEFEWIEDINTTIYPRTIKELDDDEVILNENGIIIEYGDYGPNKSNIEKEYVKNGLVIYRYGDKGGLRYYVKKYKDFIKEFGDIGYVDLNIDENNQQSFSHFIDKIAKIEDNKWIQYKYSASFNFHCQTFTIEALKELKPYFNSSNIYPQNLELATKKSKKKLDFIPSNIKTELMNFYKR